MRTDSWPKFGAALLILFAGTLALTGVPSTMVTVGTVDEWGELIRTGEDRIAPLTLAEWIAQGRPDLRIIDVRDEMMFVRFSIAGSENIPLERLLSDEGIASLSGQSTHVLICRDGSRSAQAWMVLRGLGYEAYILDRGAQGWVDDILDDLARRHETGKASGHRVSADTLRIWLESQKPGLRVIDVRSREEFEEYAIETSENVPLEDILEGKAAEELTVEHKYIVLCERERRALEAYEVMAGLGLEVSILDQGIQGWLGELLEEPEGDAIDSEDLATRVHALRKRFLGEGAVLGSPPPLDPTKPKPSPPKRKRKKVGGC